MGSTKLNFPQNLNVKLNNFTLFSKNPSASFELTKKVLCLAGANGIGKSTLLNTLNYGLTGVVPDCSASNEFGQI